MVGYRAPKRLLAATAGAIRARMLWVHRGVAETVTYPNGQGCKEKILHLIGTSRQASVQVEFLASGFLDNFCMEALKVSSPYGIFAAPTAATVADAPQ